MLSQENQTASIELSTSAIDDLIGPVWNHFIRIMKATKGSNPRGLLGTTP